MDGKLKVLNGKPDALVFGTVRPIAGSLLVAGALFCLGLMSVQAQEYAVTAATKEGLPELPDGYTGYAVTIPESVTSIVDHAFTCKHLMTTEVDKGNAFWRISDTYLEAEPWT